MGILPCRLLHPIMEEIMVANLHLGGYLPLFAHGECCRLVDPLVKDSWHGLGNIFSYSDKD